MTQSPGQGHPLDTPVGPPADVTTSQSMQRVATASLVGTVIEFYDFGIYGTAAALVFPKLFFPALGPVAGTVASFATLGVAFVARPFGSVLFGHFGDRLGRKRTLIATMLTMGVATLLVGLMPTAASIGAAAPILIVILRILQGLAAGGEWGGAVLFAAENAPKARRGFWSAAPSFGGGIAIILSNLTFWGTAVGMSDDTFLAWGWRVPFLASIVLIGVGLWIRLSTNETPLFKQQAKEGVARTPFLDAFRAQPKQILLATGTTVMTLSLTYIGGTYLVSYGTSVLKLTRPGVLGVATLGGVAISVAVVIGAVLSDRIGRRNMITIAACLAVVWTLALFPILDTRTLGAFAVGVPVTMFISGLATGPLGAFLSEIFHTSYRYTATGLSYALAGMLGGAIPPLVAGPIIATWGGFTFGVILAVVAVISLICVRLIGETKQLELDREDTEMPAVAAAA